MKTEATSKLSKAGPWQGRLNTQQQKPSRAPHSARQRQPLHQPRTAHYCNCFCVCVHLCSSRESIEEDAGHDVGCEPGCAGAGAGMVLCVIIAYSGYCIVARTRTRKNAHKPSLSRRLRDTGSRETGRLGFLEQQSREQRTTEREGP